MASNARQRDDEAQSDHEPDEMDRIMDEVAPLDEPVEAGAEPGPSSEPSERQGGDPPAPEPLPGRAEGAGGDEASVDAPRETAASSDAPPPADASAERDVPVSERSDRDKGLLSEIQKWRRKAAEAEAEAARLAQSTPHPAQPAQAPGQGAPAAQEPEVPGLQVVVSEDGSSVYVPQDAIEQLLEQRVAQTVEQRMQPTPEQIQAHHLAQATQGFVAEHGDVGQRVVERAAQADELITLRLQNLMSQGYKVGGIAEATALLHQTGVADDVAGLFPELSAVGVDEFVEGMASGNPTWRRSLFSRLAASQPGAETASGDPEPAPGGATQLRSVAGGPQALARKGGTRSQAPTANQAEFRELEGRFHAAPHAISSKDYDRLRELGKMLKAPGYEGVEG